MSSAKAASDRTSLREIALLFLKLGTIAFGGPAAHMGMMEDEVVRRRRWLSHEDFLDFLGATNLIPGPNSTELAIHIGLTRAGWPGLLVAGACFIVPASIVVTAIAWAYMRFGSMPAAAGILYGIKPVVIAVVAQALVALGRTALKTKELAVIGIGSAVAAFLGANELIVLAAAAALAVVTHVAGRQRAGARGVLALIGGFTPQRIASGAGAASVIAAAPFSLTSLFLIFLKIGSVLFGSGYVLLAFLRTDLVERLGWLSERQLLDAVAVGQITPGPVFTTATFIGYVLGGVPGAALSTLGIFLPAFVFVALSHPLLPRIRRSPIAGALLDGVNVASLALMAVVSIQLVGTAVVDWVTVLLMLVSFVLLIRYRVNSAWLVLGGALAGLIRMA